MGGRRVEGAGVGEDTFALFVEHVFLLTVGLQDAETIGRQFGRFVEPLQHGLFGNREQLRGEPGRCLTEFREDDLDLAKAALDLVVARILLAGEPWIAIDLVRDPAEFVAELRGREDLLGTLLERALETLVFVHQLLELDEIFFPCIPAGIDVGEIPRVFHRNLGPVAARRLGSRQKG